MEPDARIRRMEADGILSQKQAAMLRSALLGSGAPAGPPAQEHRRFSRWIVPAAVCTALILLFLFTGGGEERAIRDVTSSLNQPGGYGAMNRSLSTALVSVILLAVPALVWIWLHNGLVAKEEEVFKAWAQTESNFQRRADLIPALIDTVSRYVKHESETLSGVTEARSAASATLARSIDELIEAQRSLVDRERESDDQIVEDDLSLNALFAAQARIGSGITKILGVVESYPDLRSSDQFLELQAQLEGTENRINVARIRFNDAVRSYNTAIRLLPGSLVAQVGNFRRKAYFRSDEEARDAPAMQFD